MRAPSERRLPASGAPAAAVEAGRRREGGSVGGGWWVGRAGRPAWVVLADVRCSNGGLQRVARRKRYKCAWRAMPGTAAAGSKRKMPVVCGAVITEGRLLPQSAALDGSRRSRSFAVYCKLAVGLNNKVALLVARQDAASAPRRVSRNQASSAVQSPAAICVRIQVIKINAYAYM